jgi:hypothetical protein
VNFFIPVSVIGKSSILDQPSQQIKPTCQNDLCHKGLITPSRPFSSGRYTGVLFDLIQAVAKFVEWPYRENAA